MQDQIDAWDKYLEQLEWDYQEYERLENARILMELMGVSTEEEIRQKLLADMQKFNEDIKLNYQNYTTIFQDNLLTPYKEANETLAALRRERLELLDVSTAQAGNDSMVDKLSADNYGTSTYGKYEADMVNYPDLDDSTDYAALMVNAKTQEEFDKWAGYRYEKMMRNGQYASGADFGIDGSGKTFRYKSNDEIQKEWEEKRNKATGSEYWGYSSGLNNGPVTYTGLAMLHGTPTQPEYVLNSDQAYNLLRNMATTRLPEMKRTGTEDSGGTQYIVQGDVVLEGINDPAKFWTNVTNAMTSRWNVSKNKTKF